MTIVRRYPSNPITPAGAYYFLSGKKPTMAYRSYDDTSVFYLLGGMAIPDFVNAPESVRLKSLSGLIPPWQPIEQKGATQDGSTFVDALYDPIDADMTVEVCGKTPQRTAAVIRDWIAAWDAKKPGELSFFDQHAGRWWAKVRWTRDPVDKISGAQTTRQTFTWPFKAHDAFWRSYDNTDSFGFDYEDFVSTFNTDYANDLGADWPLYYTGAGIGYLHADDDQATWVDDPDSLFLTGNRVVVNGPYGGYTSADDGQTVETLFANSPEYTIGTGAANDIWLRMGDDGAGNWDGYGVRARIGWGYVSISAFNNFVETELKKEFELFPPIAGEELVFSVDDGTRDFKLTRRNIHRWLGLSGAFPLISVTDSGAVSQMGASYRGFGFGMQAGAAVITQATPGGIDRVIANDTILDKFNTAESPTLGSSWPQHYTSTGNHSDGYCHASWGAARWVDNSGTDTQEVVAGPFDDGVFSETTSDNQVVTMKFGTFQEWSFPQGAANDLWARMGRDGGGAWNGYGVRARIGIGPGGIPGQDNVITLSRFNNFTETVMKSKPLLLPPIPGESFQLVCGYEDDSRLFKVFRSGDNLSGVPYKALQLEHREVGTGSALGSAYRGIGFGMQAGAAFITQATPSALRRVSGGDHAEVSQSGMVTRINMGDQMMWDRYTLYGPGTFYIGAAPESKDMVKFGPLLPGQVVQLRTDPRKRGVVDLTSVPPSPQELSAWQESLDDFLSFAGGNNSSSLLDEIRSQAGILPPQGNLYSLLEGRFAAGVPPAPVAGQPRSYEVLVEVVGGNADTRMVVAGTPRRRWPL